MVIITDILALLLKFLEQLTIGKKNILQLQELCES